MQIIEKTYKGFVPSYPIDRFCDVNRALFIDIETTGLKKETTSLYLIGCGFYTREGFETKLFFADSTSEENLILEEFASFVKDYTHLFHFNGLKFDIPYLEYKAGLYGQCPLFTGIEQIDVYKLCKPLRYLLFPESMRQKAIEAFLQIEREDMYSGGELIEVYKSYEITKSPDDLNLLVTHNREDVLGMHLIMPILSYIDFKDAPLDYIGYTINEYKDYSGCTCEEVIFDYSTTLKFPRSFTARTESMYVRASASDGRIAIRLPLYTNDMKIFFDNYRDYFYLPEEDTAILKSAAMGLPKERYHKATKETCYTRVSGKFLKQPSDLFTPVVKAAYKDKKNYFCFPDSFNEKAADEFGRQLINVFFSMKKHLSLPL